jgi:hypothetical protein
MAVVLMQIPVCDVCGEPWLPQKGPARVDPRTHAKRCGKCKSEKWDRDYIFEAHDPEQAPAEDVIATIRGMPQDSNTANAIVELTQAAAAAVRKRCIHMLLNCPICHKGE